MSYSGDRAYDVAFCRVCRWEKEVARNQGAEGAKVESVKGENTEIIEVMVEGLKL